MNQNERKLARARAALLALKIAHFNWGFSWAIVVLVLAVLISGQGNWLAVVALAICGAVAVRSNPFKGTRIVDLGNGKFTITKGNQ